jgi:hypothetical protein
MISSVNQSYGSKNSIFEWVSKLNTEEIVANVNNLLQKEESTWSLYIRQEFPGDGGEGVLIY